MDPQVWEQSNDWAAMLSALPDINRSRKLRLWCVAWAREIIAAAPPHSVFLADVAMSFRPELLVEYAKGVDAAEAFADGKFGHRQLVGAKPATGGPWNVFHLPTGLTRLRTNEIAQTLGNFASEFSIPTTAQLAHFVRDIFGNPFRPVVFAPAWRTDTAIALARTMYEAREFSVMPILADALQDAGCDNDDMLGHCRDTTAPHVRGCWVVDLVLGKE